MRIIVPDKSFCNTFSRLDKIRNTITSLIEDKKILTQRLKYANEQVSKYHEHMVSRERVLKSITAERDELKNGVIQNK